MISSRRWTWIFILLALLVYLPGIWWGLPEGVTADRARPWGTDELGPMGAVSEVYGVFLSHNPTFNPQYPLFHYFVQLLFVAPYYAALWLSGHLSHPDAHFPFGLDNPPLELGVLTILARLASWLAAAGVVAVAFRTGEVLRGRTTGILAGFLVLLQYPMFYYARTTNVDMGAQFWTALGLLLFARILMTGATMRLGLALGIVAALAAASKDASYAAFVPVGIVVLLQHVRASRRMGATWIDTWRMPAYAFLATVAVYAVSSGLVFRPSRFVQHLRFITTHNGEVGVFYFRYPATFRGYLDLARELAQCVRDAMGVPMLLTAVAGIGLWTARRQTALWLWSLPALSVIALVIVPVRFALLRFVLLVAYVLAIAAADVLAQAMRRPPAVRRATWLTLAVILGWSGLRGADLTVQMLRDSRYIGAEWLRAVARPGDSVGHIVPAHNLPYLPEGVRTMQLKPAGLGSLPADRRPEFIVSMPLLDIETVHERVLPEETFQQLTAGTIGYRQAALLQGPTLFVHRPASYLNPPLRIFVREDVWQSRLARK